VLPGAGGASLSHSHLVRCLVTVARRLLFFESMVLVFRMCASRRRRRWRGACWGMAIVESVGACERCCMLDVCGEAPAGEWLLVIAVGTYTSHVCRQCKVWLCSWLLGCHETKRRSSRTIVCCLGQSPSSGCVCVCTWVLQCKDCDQSMACASDAAPKPFCKGHRVCCFCLPVAFCQAFR
jgi:hypothetical protein